MVGPGMHSPLDRLTDGSDEEWWWRSGLAAAGPALPAAVESREVS